MAEERDDKKTLILRWWGRKHFFFFEYSDLLQLQRRKPNETDMLLHFLSQPKKCTQRLPHIQHTNTHTYNIHKHTHTTNTHTHAYISTYRKLYSKHKLSVIWLNSFTPKIKMQILWTIHVGNVWVMLWELIATSAIVWAKYKMPCFPLCTSSVGEISLDQFQEWKG